MLHLRGLYLACRWRTVGLLLISGPETGSLRFPWLLLRIWQPFFHGLSTHGMLSPVFLVAVWNSRNSKRGHLSGGDYWSLCILCAQGVAFNCTNTLIELWRIPLPFLMIDHNMSTATKWFVTAVHDTQHVTDFFTNFALTWLIEFEWQCMKWLCFCCFTSRLSGAGLRYNLHNSSGCWTYLRIDLLLAPILSPTESVSVPRDVGHKLALYFHFGWARKLKSPNTCSASSVMIPKLWLWYNTSLNIAILLLNWYSDRT